jgi:hypothetical protein
MAVTVGARIGVMPWTKEDSTKAKRSLSKGESRDADPKYQALREKIKEELCQGT